MSRINEIFNNRFKSGEIFKPWLWPGILVYLFTRPIAPGLFLINFVFQRIFRINAEQKFMVHYTSKVSGKVELGEKVWISFASSGGCYVQGDNGIFIGENTIFAPGVKIISANHDKNDFGKQEKGNPITIGKNCWLAANCVVLPEVELGDNVVVGAGAVVTKSFPDNVIIAGVPAKIIGENTKL